MLMLYDVDGWYDGLLVSKSGFMHKKQSERVATRRASIIGWQHISDLI